MNKATIGRHSGALLSFAARCAGCLLLLPLAADAADWHPLEGIYALTAEGYLDPAADDPNDSHLRIQLRGANAKALYHAMHVTPVTDECTGGRAKNVGQMQCLFFDRDATYECHFSIKLDEQQIDYGVAC